MTYTRGNLHPGATYVRILQCKIYTSVSYVHPGVTFTTANRVHTLIVAAVAADVMMDTECQDNVRLSYKLVLSRPTEVALWVGAHRGNVLQQMRDAHR